MNSGLVPKHFSKATNKSLSQFEPGKMTIEIFFSFNTRNYFFTILKFSIIGLAKRSLLIFSISLK